MIKRIALTAVLLASCLLSADERTKKNPAPSDAELAAITARGRMLAEYDVAAWHATDAVEALKPDQAVAPLYIAKKIDSGWEVAFGRLGENRDRFLIVYRASQGASPKEFTVKKIDPPLEDHDFYLAAAKAIETTSRDFGHPSRAYNTYVFPSETGQLYVYLLPAQTVKGVFPLGGDVRYTLTSDGSMIAEKRQMHKTILESKDSLKPGQKLAAGYHTHILSDEPEDSDVFHVLSRKPSLPEFVGTPDKHVYSIQTDGSIRRVQ